MPLDFPSSPANGDVYGSYVYDSNLPGWRSKGGAVAATYVSDTAPSGAVKGDMWYRSSDGTTYVYVVDADTSQWVEIRSEISTSKVGLVPIVPTSVTLSSGSASVAADGVVSFTSSGSFVLNNCFTSTYRNYKLLVNIESYSVVADYIFLQTASGGGGAGGTYQTRGTIQTGTSAPGQWVDAGSSYGYAGRIAGDSSLTYDIFDPKTTRRTRFLGQTHGYVSSETLWTISMMHDSLVSYDGIRVFMGSGLIQGTAKIYGYN